MVDVSTLKPGDKLRRIRESGHDVKLGEVVTLQKSRYGDGVTIKGKITGLAIPKNWELVKSEEEPLMTTQTVDAEQLLAKLEELTKEVAKFIAQEKAGTTPRLEVIKKAKQEVAYEEKRRERGYYTPLEFHVNDKKGTVVALRRSIGGAVIKVGKAKVSRDDKFDVHIGKAIAMRRALGQPDLDVYVDAPQR